MLEINNLKAGYGGAEILKEISFKLNSDGFLTIIGQNGCGKSTLLKSIFNQAEIYSGKIFFNKQEITKKPAYSLIELGISYVPQGRQIFGNMTVLENLEMAVFAFKDKKENLSKIEEILQRFPTLKEKIHQKASTLSGGQQQLLAISRALMQKPKLLLMDEPSLGLSPIVSKEIFAEVKKIHKQGVGIILVEQNIAGALEITDDLCFLRQGEIGFMGKKAEVTQDLLKKLYLE